jgi:hypothetical protein
MSALASLRGLKTNEEEVIGGRATGFATKAGFAAALTAITGVVLAIVQEVDSSNVHLAVKVAALGLIGVGALAWSIAATGDVLARAYASAHVVAATPASNTPTPVAQWALTPANGAPSPVQATLAGALGALAGSQQKNTGSNGQVVTMCSTKVHYGQDDYFAVAMRIAQDKPGELSLLLVRDGTTPQWVDGNQVTFVA